MGFTAVMDALEQLDESGGEPAGRGSAATVRRSADGGREEERSARQGHEALVRVRWLSPAGRESVQAERQLLAALEVAGVRAAPDLLDLEDDGYVRESAPPLHRRSGRRSGDDLAPPTAERIALARAREDLDALIEALHERGWVLGAIGEQGLGVRADGSVVVRDLSGLRPGTRLAAQRADRRWVDAVLQDGERTLRRRVHGRATTSEEGTAEQGAMWHHGRSGSPPDPARRRTWRQGGTTPTVRRGRGPMRRMGAVVREVLAQARHRRTAALTALTVLLLAGTAAVVVGTGWWPGTTRPGAAEPAAAARAPGEESRPASIEHPWELAAELAGARHAYVTGLSAEPVAVPGSEAAAVDEEVRIAYQDVEVRGGGPIVHEAELIHGMSADGTATLRLLTSTEEHEVVAPDGSSRTVPATDPAVVELELLWEGGRWWVQRAEAIP
ncbi:hypothetical protein [Brachybacterium sp. YJGR34]|uniref:hypothetical protein n=1 Tax=Brachybacterium sp. YJGR34 TaxID=2059911 RepID=UPI000E0B788F|nr:hypothetical protein [Brachybacterium sp. YJGR34]